MKKTDNKTYNLLSILFFLAIVGITTFAIIPKYLPATTEKIVEKVDFSNSAWIEQYVDKSVGIFGNDFFQSTAFSYSKSFSKMVVVYASQKSVDEARNYYLALPGAEQIGRNDESSLNIKAEKDGQILEVYNYYSPIARVFKLDLTLDAENAEKIKNQLKVAFPTDDVAKIPEIKDLVSGEIYGGYVRYQFDNLDDFAYPNTPIFSQAYVFNDVEQDFNQTITVLNKAYPKNKYDETQNTHYYLINDQIVSLSFLVTDTNEKIVSVSVQKK